MKKYKHEYVVDITTVKASKKAKKALENSVRISLISGYGKNQMGVKIKMEMDDGSKEIIRISDKRYDCGFIMHAILRIREIARSK